ncbi:MAG: peptidoglycan DD-metalloendopeptidase family protein [Candidatus Omnitrophica bacterium]|nr:peptidoglycan DD-metalloendopeptidase family protein [Candidatus Omnitrophota bacterium]
MPIHLRISVLCLLFISGCVTGPVPVGFKPAPLPAGGVYHKVSKGQTLWRISKTYGVSIEELVAINKIQDSSRIEVGQMLVVPRTLNAKTGAAAFPADDDFIWPLKGKVIADYGQSVNNTVNKGLNIQPLYNGDIVASAAGKVVFLDQDFPGLGKTLIIEHAGGFRTVYGRNNEVFVKPGDIINKGAVIARIIPGGREKSGFLHFEIRKGAMSQNPYFYLP